MQQREGDEAFCRAFNVVSKGESNTNNWLEKSRAYIDMLDMEEEAMFDYWGEYFKQMGGEDAEFTDEVMEKFKGYYYEAKSSANQGVFDLSMEEGDGQVLEPIEIEFEEQEGVNWRVAASEYIKKELAGRVFDMPDGYRVAIPKGRDARDRMVKGLRSQKKYEFVKGLERVFEVARLIQKNEPQHKVHESKRKERLVDKANSYNVFGYPLLINGHLCYGWFGAFNFDKDAPKDVVFYEFGVKEEDGFSGMVVGHDENHEVHPQLNPSSSEVTLGDLKRVVKENNEGSEFSLEEELKAHFYKDPYGDAPDGWWVHGRRSRSDLNTGYVIQMTQSNDIGVQYGRNGSIWYLRPKANAVVVDMTDKENQEKVVQAILEQVSEYGYFADWDEWMLKEYLYSENTGEIDENKVRDFVEETYNPSDIVESAGGFDNSELTRFLYDVFLGVGMFITNDGAVACDLEQMEMVKVYDVENDEIDFSLEEVGLKSHAPGVRETNFSAEWEYELVGIRMRAEEEGVFMKAPNGEPSHLSERLWCVVRTKAFKAWFGDWENDPENASKVVDENGEPLVVYHGTEKDFGNVFRDVHTDDDFNNDDFGLLAAETFWFADKKFTAQTYQTGVFVPQGETKTLIPAPHGSILISKEDTDFFFVRCPKNGPWSDGKRITASEALKKDGRLKANCIAFLYLKKGAKVPSGYQGFNGRLLDWYPHTPKTPPRTHEEAVEQWNSNEEIQEMLAPASSRLYEVFLNIRNPKIIDEGGERFHRTGVKATQARREGYDGVIFKNVRDPRSYPALIENGCSIAAFSPNQIKSATDNRGTFNAKSDRIDMSLEEAKEQGLFDNGVGVFGNAVVVEPGTDFDIEALHASPHLFPKFDTAFMGSGEGAQAYGWGLYFATNYGVNKWYFRMFNNAKTFVKIDGVNLRDVVYECSRDSLLGKLYYFNSRDLSKLTNEIYNEIHYPRWKDRLVEKSKALIESCKMRLESDISDYMKGMAKETLEFNEKQLEYYRNLEELVASHDVQAVKPRATNYMVTLKAEDNEFLEWDEMVNLSELSEAVRKGVEELTGAKDFGFLSGREFYYTLVEALGSPKAASEWLLERGIKGVKYADVGSLRGRGAMSYNYVMFSGDDVVIEKIDRSGEWNVNFEDWESPDAVFGETNHSLLGEHAKTFWEYDESRMFKGRDDGKLRVEIDSSVAGLREEWKNDSRARIDAYDEELYEKEKWCVEKGVEAFRGIVEKYGEEFVEKWGEVGERYMEALGGTDTEEIEAAKQEIRGLGEKGEEMTAEMVNKLGEMHGAFSFNMSLWYELCKRVRGGEDEWSDTLGFEFGRWVTKKREEARENGEFNRRALERETSMGEVFDFPELYAAYPELKELTFDVYQLEDAAGIYKSQDKTIVLDEEFWQTRSDEWMKSVILHELGHAVQDIEGWADGGSPEWVRYKLNRQIDKVALPLKRAHEKLRWFRGREIAMDFLKSIRKLQKNPKSVLKMGVRFDVKETQDVNVMAEQAIESLIDSYKTLKDVDDGHTYWIFEDIVNGKESSRWYYLPWFNKENYEKDKEGYIERMLDYVKEDMVSRNNKKWQKELKKEREAEVERLYKGKEKEWLDAKSQLSDKELYYQLAGEMESRAIQSRMGMSMEERLAKPFNESLDRSADDAIVYFRGDDDLRPSMSHGAMGLKSHGPEGSEFSVTATDRNGGVMEANWSLETFSKEEALNKWEKENIPQTERYVYIDVDGMKVDLAVFGDGNGSINGKSIRRKIIDQLPKRDLYAEAREEWKNKVLSLIKGSSDEEKIKAEFKQGHLVYSKYSKESLLDYIQRSHGRPTDDVPNSLMGLELVRSMARHGFKGRVLTEADLVKGESREREDGSDFCIIGEGSEVFGEYEEAGLVYVDKADGKKKAVLDNRGVKLKHGLGGVPKTGAKVTSLGAVLEYPELFRAYPELKKLRVDLFRGDPHLGGYAVQEENYIAVNVESGAWTSPLRTILHEVQHIIQGAEGFARGAGGMEDPKRAVAYIEKSIEQLRARDDEWAKDRDFNETGQTGVFKVYKRRIRKSREVLPTEHSFDERNFKSLGSISRLQG